MKTVKQKRLRLSSLTLEFAELINQKAQSVEDWRVYQISKPLEERLELERKITEIKVEIAKLKNEIKQSNGNDVVRVEYYWRAIKEILEENGQGELIAEAKKRGALYQVARENIPKD